MATAIITFSFFLMAIAISFFLAPIFYEQFLTFLHSIPTYVAYLNKNIVPEFTNILKRIDQQALAKAKDSIGGASGYTLQVLGSVAANLVTSGIAVLNILSLIFVTPIVTFYILRDWDKILRKINSWLPVKYAKVIRKMASEIDGILAGYVRGQTHVCFVVGVYYAAALTLAGLEFSLLIGFATGILLFIPYVGTLFCFAVAILVAFFQFGDLQHVVFIAAIFLLGQLLEGVFLTPNLVGNKVQLHPAWIMFGLLAGGAIFGLSGVLVAVPVTAVIGVLARAFIREYLEYGKKSGKVIAQG
jgi:predicted PurR-regulated permease PerM